MALCVVAAVTWSKDRPWKLDISQWEWQQLRPVILDRDGWRCRLCGAALHRKQCRPKACDLDAQVDHIRPVADGGLSTPDNLRAVCRGCNMRKAHGLAPATVAAARDAPSRVW